MKLVEQGYDRLAESFANSANNKFEHRYIERPHAFSLLGELKGLRVLDAGCGPGDYLEELLRRGAVPVGVDISAEMLRYARARVGDGVELHQLDLSRPLVTFSNEEFDVVNAALSLDHVPDLESTFGEIRRILKIGGLFVFSMEHPFVTYLHYKPQAFLGPQEVEHKFQGFSEDVISVPDHYRAISDIVNPLLATGFCLSKVVEGVPIEAGKENPRKFQMYTKLPPFIFFQARKS